MIDVYVFGLWVCGVISLVGAGIMTVVWALERENYLNGSIADRREQGRTAFWAMVCYAGLLLTAVWPLVFPVATVYGGIRMFRAMWSDYKGNQPDERK